MMCVLWTLGIDSRAMSSQYMGKVFRTGEFTTPQVVLMIINDESYGNGKAVISRWAGDTAAWRKIKKDLDSWEDVLRVLVLEEEEESGGSTEETPKGRNARRKRRHSSGT